MRVSPWMPFRLTLALLAGRAAAFASRRFGRGGGTVLPGHVVPRIHPHAVDRVIDQLPHGTVLLSGTNGKTTTTRMISHIATGSGLHPIHNRSGANLMTGIVTAIVLNADLRGRPRGDIGVFEADEAQVPAAVEAVRPRVLALLNIFRDQLDRYGEVDLVARIWRDAVARLDPEATLVLNVDDPLAAQVASAARGPVVTFGLQVQSVGSPELSHEADKRLCPMCGHRLQYTWSYFGHIGHYLCQACGWHRPRPDVSIERIDTGRDGRMELTMRTGAGELSTVLPLPGVYNAYNALAAVSVCQVLGLPTPAIAEGLRTFTAVFGRQERVHVGEGSIVLALVKNPVGFNQVLSWGFGSSSLFVIAVNDLLADGTDVSWLWDVDFEPLAGSVERIVCTGLRAQDMALRLKYALASPSQIVTEPRVDRAVDMAVQAAAAGGHVVVFPTYTAMLTIRRELQRRRIVAPFWED
ncbi:MAG: DUF1727 domain-containing protein [Chloroflexi bacterium]|nr:DUF1727 domain-containing protein [Chloroflexota bacterium]